MWINLKGAEWKKPDVKDCTFCDSTYWNSKKVKTVPESRSVVSREQGSEEEDGLQRGTREWMSGVTEIFYIIILVPVIILHTIFRTHWVAHLTLVNLLYLDYTSIKPAPSQPSGCCNPQEHLCPNAFASDFDTPWLLRWRLQMVHTPLALPLSGPEVACSPRQQIIYNPKPLLPWPSNLKVATLYPGTTDWGNTPGMDYTSRSLTV